jgi:hypothetical protein
MNTINNQMIKIEMFVQSYSDFFEPDDLTQIISNLKDLDGQQLNLLQRLEYQQVKPFYRMGVLDLMFEKTRNPRKYNLNLIMNKIAVFKTENINKQNEFEIKKQMIQKALEDLRIAAEHKALNESYFLAEEGGETPYTLEEIKEKLSLGAIKINTKIKLGYNTETYSKVLDFEELNQGFRDFI